MSPHDPAPAYCDVESCRAPLDGWRELAHGRCDTCLRRDPAYCGDCNLFTREPPHGFSRSGCLDRVCRSPECSASRAFDAREAFRHPDEES